VLAAALTLGACAGPRDVTPPGPFSGAYAPSGDTKTLPEADGVAQRLSDSAPGETWWRDFGSDALDRLVEAALTGNPDLEAARANLTAASETWKAQQTTLWPRLGLSYTAEKAMTAGSLASPLSGNSPANPYVLHTAQLTLSYTPDLWGGQGASIRLARAGRDQAAWQWQAARTLVISNVLTAALTRASLKEQVDAMGRAVGASREMLADMEAQRRMGNASEADVAPYAAGFAQDEQAEAALRHALFVEDTILRQLMGREPAEAVDTVLTTEVRLPATLPYSLPAELVGRRPDVAVARAQLSAACAAAGMADAARLPVLNLTALGGGSGNRLADLTRHDDRFWDLALGLTAPLTDGVALAHQARAAYAQLDAARANYRSAVLHALGDAANVLDALDQDAVSLDAAIQADTLASRAAANLDRQLKTGDTGRLQFLAAERQAAQARAALSNARLQRLTDTIALYVAMGGGPAGKETGR
jgi:NodT family efflux transporter outer membrane factor (OMF) lipoprotein